MTWRVATRPGTALLEVIDEEDWNDFSAGKQGRYQPVRLFATEQEADKFVTGQIEAAKPVPVKLPRRGGRRREACEAALPHVSSPCCPRPSPLA
jgi:hypothetical protein